MSYQRTENELVEVQITHLQVGKHRRGAIVFLPDNAYLETLVRGGFVAVVNPPDWELSDPLEGFLTAKKPGEKALEELPVEKVVEEAAESVEELPVGKAVEELFEESEKEAEVLSAEELSVEELSIEITTKPYKKLTDLPKKAAENG